MRTSQMTSKGQVTIPVEIRSALSLKQGDRVGFVELEKDAFAIVSANFPVQRLKGLVRKPRKPVSIENMNAAIAARGAGR
ncbi:MAG: AbrB/MazE/SpoVT family DNA-binding domain-containing protein [Burkholderiales bacterium]|jgi:AbrB family looped-hinge helix DNA binding protein|nr:AbrB/MazE/SpoVT family DNA-binding domain-containing protein [Burkholderiales bacterium]